MAREVDRYGPVAAGSLPDERADADQPPAGRPQPRSRGRYPQAAGCGPPRRAAARDDPRMTERPRRPGPAGARVARDRGARALAAACTPLVALALVAGAPGTTPHAAAATDVGAPRELDLAPRVVAPRAVGPLEPFVVLRSFEPPPRPWAAGHRGVDLAADVGQPVRSPLAGTVTFAGPVAGRDVLVVSHAGGLVSSFEPVDGVAVGTRVEPGELVGTVTAGTGHCAPRACVHWGVRVSPDSYVDPLVLLGLGPVVLLG